MGLNEIIEKDFTRAYKEKSEHEILALRMLKSALKNASIQKTGKLTDDEIVKVISTEIKKRTESAEMFLQGKRNDLAAKEQAEIEVLKRYLPEQISENEITAIIDEVIRSQNASTAGDFGRVMGAVAKLTAGRADNKMIAELIKKRLEEKNKIK
ncbi:GatB/YqeY domain-containing protein [Candidatus Parcubacteria bacterium]|nr:MAG: GatB/YqeY domain-containing protein [Candidatus Parcubacteria bacterium]